MMSIPSVAFLRQPVEALAREGKGFTQRVINTLHGWASSDRTANVVRELHKRIFILSEAAADWNIAVIVRDVPPGAEWRVDVCFVDFSEPDHLLEQFEALVEVDWLASVMQVRLDKIEPKMFTAVADEFASTRLSCESHWLRRYSRVSSLMRMFDSDAPRWASSTARTHFRNLLDDARLRPQVVERGGDDMVVVSRRYLQEAVEPTSAQALSRRYRAMALPDSDMPYTEPRMLTPLGDLTPLGPV